MTNGCLSHLEKIGEKKLTPGVFADERRGGESDRERKGERERERSKDKVNK